jgi:Raf kinase inhibitor-like YbhB/YbcL family protein
MEFALTAPACVAAELAAGGSPAAAAIPARFAMRGIPGGQNISVPYSWGTAPAGTRSLALTLIDASPVAHDWVHWLVVDIPADATGLPEGASGGSAMPSGALELRNTFKFTGYGGPQPPAGTGAHTYVATLYALDVDRLNVDEGASLDQVRRAMDGHVIAIATCTGLLGK